MSRNWVFTLNNYTDEDYNLIKNYDCVYMIIGKELGDNKTPHLQGYIQFKNGKTLKTLKNFIDKAHWEPAKGTGIQNKNYCSKEGIDIFEKGKMKEQGKRTDLIKIKEAVKDDFKYKDMFEISKNYQGLMVAKEAFKIFEKPRDWKPTVLWFYGKAGTGKTFTATTLCKKPYIHRGGKWWEGYDAHEDVILDDIRPDTYEFTYLLGLLDRYEFRVEYKGGSRQFKAKQIIITSNKHPTEFSKFEETKQLTRRITEIRRF